MAALERPLSRDSSSPVITVDEENRIMKLFFNSYELGTTELDRQGLVACNRWETEDQAQSVSYLARRFPIILQNGAEDADYAKLIMTRVLERIESDYLNRLAEDFCNRKISEVFFDSARLENE